MGQSNVKAEETEDLSEDTAGEVSEELEDRPLRDRGGSEGSATEEDSVVEQEDRAGPVIRQSTPIGIMRERRDPTAFIGSLPHHMRPITGEADAGRSPGRRSTASEGTGDSLSETTSSANVSADDGDSTDALTAGGGSRGSTGGGINGGDGGVRGERAGGNGGGRGAGKGGPGPAVNPTSGGSSGGGKGGMPETTVVREDGVVLFRWTQPGAKTVRVSGSFNDWGEPITLRKKPNGTFESNMKLPEGQYEYKFVVDSEWRHDPTQQLKRSQLGSVNNFFQVPGPTPEGDARKKKKKDEKRKRGHKREHSNFSIDLDLTLDDLVNFGRNTPPGEYGTVVPDFADAKPPALPPQLLEATLNSQPLGNDPSELPEPNHTSLNHLYALSVKDNVMVLGTTNRFKTKYVTTVLYKPFDDSVNAAAAGASADALTSTA